MWMLSFPDNDDADPWTGLCGEGDVFDAIKDEIEQRADDAYFMTEREVALDVAKAFGELWPCPISNTTKIIGGRVLLTNTD